MANWTDKVVVVTGGSSGLGRAIAAEFADAGARVVCLARDEQKLVQAANQLSQTGAQVSGVVADVTDDQSVAAAVAEIKNRHGQIDVWINNVGRSLRIGLTDAQVEDFQELMEINFLSVVRCCLAALPELDRTSGHLVNIGSLASKTGWPLVAPYSASKHALAAYHHQLRLEGPRSIHYLLVCPGPIRRSDAGSRYADQASMLSEEASKPGAGVKLKGIPPEEIAQRIRAACESRKDDLVLPGKARIAFALAQLSPRLGDYLLKKFSSSKN
jgi:NAD(P)-dependent dehydrogenase (short-subunit alcohol dehydrogenase family)